MAAVGYAVQQGAAVALSAATAKSILGIRAGASFSIQLKAFGVAFDGVTASDVPVLVEICTATFATNAPGTNSTTVTPAQKYGRLLTHGMTAARNWTAEPTVLAVIKSFLLTPNGGTLEFQYPLGTEPDVPLNNGFVIRCTAPAAVNVRSNIDVERV